MRDTCHVVNFPSFSRREFRLLAKYFREDGRRRSREFLRVSVSTCLKWTRETAESTPPGARGKAENAGNSTNPGLRIFAEPQKRGNRISLFNYHSQRKISRFIRAQAMFSIFSESLRVLNYVIVRLFAEKCKIYESPEPNYMSCLIQDRRLVHF